MNKNDLAKNSILSTAYSYSYTIQTQTFRLKIHGLLFLHLRGRTTVCITIGLTYRVSQKSPLRFSDIFPKQSGVFSPNFTRLLHVPIYARVQIFIQLPATLTKLCHIKRDHHNVLKMSTIDRNASLVVALNMA